MDGYVGNIMVALDLADPAKPVEAGRWWVPGQWAAGGETPTWDGWAHRIHHSLRYDNRLYTSLWHGGFAILDVDDLSKPTFISGLDWSPPFPWPTHSAVKVPFKIDGRDMLVVADEDVFGVIDAVLLAGHEQQGQGEQIELQGTHAASRGSGISLPPLTLTRRGL
jgi:hypothetical protein